MTKIIRNAAVLILAATVIAASFVGCSKKEKDKKETDTVKVTDSADDKKGGTENGKGYVSDKKSEGGENSAVTDKDGNEIKESGKTTDSAGNQGSGTSGGTGGNGGTGGSSSGSGSGSGGSSNASSGGTTGGSSAGGSSDVLPSDFGSLYDPSKAVLPDGITLGKMEIVFFDGSPSLNVSVTNSTGEEKSVDFSYIVFKPKGGKEFSQFFGSIPVKADRTVVCSFPIDAKLASFNAGDSVDVCYGNTLLDTVTVK